MNNLFKIAFIILTSILISSCAIKLSKVTYTCEYISPITSSYGRWFNYLFISNTDLTEGAIDDMYNQANKIGANVVYINNNIDFVTSVTLLGQAYICP
jgi:hypothetical protein